MIYENNILLSHDWLWVQKILKVYFTTLICLVKLKIIYNLLRQKNQYKLLYIFVSFLFSSRYVIIIWTNLGRKTII